MSFKISTGFIRSNFKDYFSRRGRLNAERVIHIDIHDVNIFYFFSYPFVQYFTFKITYLLTYLLTPWSRVLEKLTNKLCR
jgi:hypothetical protein